MAKVGVGGTIHGYGVLVLGDDVVVERNGERPPAARSRGWDASSSLHGT
jgi:hypothetical protein